jgi:hypothetical protein
MYISLLLDYQNIIKPNKDKLTSFMKKINFDSFYPSFFKERSGVVITITIKDFETLDSLKKDEKIFYINTLSILSYCAIIYDDKKGIVMTPIKNFVYLSSVLEGMLTYLPNNEYILVIFPIKNSGVNMKNIEENIENYTTLGFSNPFLVSKTPFGDELISSMTLTRKNEYTDKISMNKYRETLLDISYVLSKGTTCSFNFNLSRDSLNFLENLCKKAGSTLNKDKSISQKEVSGGFKIVSSKIVNGLNIFLMEIDSDLTSYNNNESAEISPSLYNFHTHPLLAYKNHNVKIAWPSPDDYSAFLNSVQRYNTIFHILASIEGIYLISFSEYWAINYDSLDVSQGWIQKNYNFKYDLPLNEKEIPDEKPIFILKRDGIKSIENIVKKYIKNTNKILYKNYPIFKVQFFTWRESSVFDIVYPRFAGNCFYSPSALEMYQKFYLKT